MANTDEATVRRVRATLESERRINLHRHPLKIGLAAGALVLEGEVGSIAAKKLALRLAAGAAEVRGIVDRLRVEPTERKGDGAIRDSFCALLMEQPELRRCTIRTFRKGRGETLRDVGTQGDGSIEASIDEGVITLEGTVGSLTHKRLAGVLAWWTPGCRDVVNSLDVSPAEDDNDGEVIDALALVLEMDPLVRSDLITIDCRDYVVTLKGIVRSEGERQQAERDAWALFAVDEVVDELEVAAVPASPGATS